MSAGGARTGVGDSAQPPALQKAKTSGDLNVAPAALSDQANCVRVTYGRCSPVGITELLIERAKREPPGVRLALLHVWRVLVASSNAKLQSLEQLWIKADLDPQVVVTPEDRARAEAAAEEALAPCRLCIVDLPSFLQLVRRVTLAARPNGDLTLVVEVEYNGDVAVVATRLSAWIKQTKEGIEYVVPLVFRENLRRLGLEVDADPYDLYMELTRRAEFYAAVADAYLRPILLQALERLRVSPHLAKCTKDNKVIYIATELFRIAGWYFDSSVGLGRNTLYETFRRHGLLATPVTISITLSDEFGNRIKRRALAFLIDRLSEFVDYDVLSICRAAAGLSAAENDEQTPPGDGYA